MPPARMHSLPARMHSLGMVVVAKPSVATRMQQVEVVPPSSFLRLALRFRSFARSTHSAFVLESVFRGVLIVTHHAVVQLCFWCSQLAVAAVAVESKTMIVAHMGDENIQTPS